jgi:hypothetical protein
MKIAEKFLNTTKANPNLPPQKLNPGLGRDGVECRFHQGNCYGDFVQASRLNRLNNFCLYLVGYIFGKNWSFVIGYWLFVIFFGSE